MKAVTLTGKTPADLAAMLGNKCIICGSPSSAIGIFDPKPEWRARYHVTQDKVMAYLVCPDHMPPNEADMEKIEQIMAEESAAEHN